MKILSLVTLAFVATACGQTASQSTTQSASKTTDPALVESLKNQFKSASVPSEAQLVTGKSLTCDYVTTEPGMVKENERMANYLQFKKDGSKILISPKRLDEVVVFENDKSVLFDGLIALAVMKIRTIANGDLIIEQSQTATSHAPLSEAAKADRFVTAYILCSDKSVL